MRRGRRKLRKVVELLAQVKNLFLQIEDFAGTKLRKSQAALRHFELTSQGGLAKAAPPFPDQSGSIRRHSLQQSPYPADSGGTRNGGSYPRLSRSCLLPVT